MKQKILLLLILTGTVFTACDHDSVAIEESTQTLETNQIVSQLKNDEPTKPAQNYTGPSSLKIKNWTSLSDRQKKAVKQVIKKINLAQTSRDRGTLYRVKIDTDGTLYQSDEWEYRDHTASVLANAFAFFVGGIPVWATGNDETEGSLFLRDVIDSPRQIEINVLTSGITQTRAEGNTITVNWNINDNRYINIDRNREGEASQRVSPTDVTLFHELIHALHIADRRDAQGYISHEVNRRINAANRTNYFLGNENIPREEYNTVGFGNTDPSAFTENNYRAWTGRPARVSYTNQNPHAPCGGACSDPLFCGSCSNNHDELK
ncbi:hypothetical protein HN014_13225 [Aquimarina sp. TRL1]|uniref:M91 family zinc metallopeptidase n=1 Tax=Aquimarina sp. (strain TRL1) TaxID=2736252 RepID=UPI001588E7B5|nr:M91 family zinc metallopeptidase [Aquimarina sp. TRL1]QKX05827.1 hypothetical protein HN014_13225 [Aquimarina sp. TRL1]